MKWNGHSSASTTLFVTYMWFLWLTLRSHVAVEKCQSVEAKREAKERDYEAQINLRVSMMVSIGHLCNSHSNTIAALLYLCLTFIHSKL